MSRQISTSPLSRQPSLTGVVWTETPDRRFIFLALALLVPYTSHLVPALYGDGLFPIRPLYYLASLGLILLVWSVFKGIELSKAALLLLSLLLFRLTDAAAFQRYLFPDGHQEAVMGLGASFFSALVALSVIGVLLRNGPGPLLLLSGATILTVSFSIGVESAGFMSFTTVEGRLAGFPGDANDACMVMNLMLAVFLTLNQRFWLNASMLLITGLSVLPTLSRGGFLVFLLIALVFVAINLKRHFSKLLLCAVLALPVFVAVVTYLMGSASSNGQTDENAQRRLSALFSGDVEAVQSQERLKDLADGWAGISEAPLFGHGTGAGSTLYQPHNQLVTVWIDNGIVGALTFAAFLGILSIKCALSRGYGVLILVPLFAYIALAQSLLGNHAYLFAAFAASVLMTKHHLSIRLLRPSAITFSSAPVFTPSQSS